MPRDQRYVPPGTLLEITTRTFQGRLLLTPTVEVRDAVLGVLGFALLLFPGIQLHGFICLTNHYHALLTAPDPETLSRFMCFLNGNIARKVSKIIGWSGAFWSRRYADIPVLDDAAAVERFEYLLRNSCKECLVSNPLEWPGATCVRALVFGETVRGKWINETEFSRARRRWKRVGEEAGEPEPVARDFTHWFDVPVHPIRCWRDKPEVERRQLCSEIVDRIASEMAGVDVVGVERLRAQNPFSRPRRSSHSPEPKCHASSVERWRIFVLEHRELREIYRRASTRIRNGEFTTLPPWTLPPPAHFRPTQNLADRTWESFVTPPQ